MNASFRLPNTNGNLRTLAMGVSIGPNTYLASTSGHIALPDHLFATAGTLTQLINGTDANSYTWTSVDLNKAFLKYNKDQQAGDSFVLRSKAMKLKGTDAGFEVSANDVRLDGGDVWHGEFNVSFEEGIIRLERPDQFVEVAPTFINMEDTGGLHQRHSYIEITKEGNGWVIVPNTNNIERTLAIGFQAGYDTFYADADGIFRMPVGSFQMYAPSSDTPFGLNEYDVLIRSFASSSIDLELTTNNHSLIAGASIIIIANDTAQIRFTIDTPMRKTNTSGTMITANTLLTVPAGHSLHLKRVSGHYIATLTTYVAW